ncbi:MAG: hypothetical protein RL009_1006 [Actinomycetota bacterium]
MSIPILAGAIGLAKNYDWKILPVHGIDEQGRCTCGKSHGDNREVGKHPALNAWNTEATSETAKDSPSPNWPMQWESLKRTYLC